MIDNPINDHCRRLLENTFSTLRQELEINTTNFDGHDPGDEDPNAWS